MFKKLKGIEIKIEQLDDKKKYLCEQYTKKDKIKLEENIVVEGRVLKDLSEIQGMKNGLIIYSNNILYKVLKQIDD